MNEIIPSFQKSIFNSDVNDVLKEFTEIGIDSFIKNEVIENIPIVKTILGVGRVAQTLHDRNLLKQTLTFIEALNSKTLSDEKRMKYFKKLENHKTREEELGRVLILLNRSIDKEKSCWLGNLYRNYVYENITWEKFKELSQIVEQLFPSDERILLKVLKREIQETSNNNRDIFSRLEGLGLINTSPKGIYTIDNQTFHDKYVSLSRLGQIFIDNIR